MRAPWPSRLAAAALLAMALAACAPVPPAAPAPVAPQITEETLRARAKDQLATGLKLYETGDYDGAQKSLAASLDHGLLQRADQGIARKHLAFVHCISGREGPCRDEFRKAFEIDPNFALTTAEDGHPIWGPVYRDVRAKLIAERQAAEGKPRVALDKAEQALADGILKYDAGDFAEALKLFETATREGLKQKEDQVRSLKRSAFCLCLLGRYPACRTQFLKIFELDPAFDLAPAESGHPSWKQTFAGAKAQAVRAQAEKEKLAKPRAEPAKPAISAGPKPPAAPGTAPVPAPAPVPASPAASTPKGPS